MTKEDFAKRLHGNEYYNEITEQDQVLAEKNGFVVIYGWDDDATIFRGKIYGDSYTNRGGTIYFVNGKFVDDYMKEPFGGNNDALIKYLEKYDFLKTKKTIKAMWNNDSIEWTYKTDIPHVTFDIMKDGDIFCRGIVIEQSDL